MRVRNMMRKILACTILMILFGGVSFEAFAQQQQPQRRRLRYPRRTAPVRQVNTPVSAGVTQDAEVVGSTADNGTGGNAADASGGTTNKQTAPESESESLRRTVENLSTQINSLTRKINDLEDQQRSTVDLERLTRAEQRAETLRAQLRDLEQRQSDLRAGIAQIDYQLQPANLERSTATIGTVNPEELRAQVRAQLGKDRQRLAEQLDRLSPSIERLQSALTTADAYVDRLRESVKIEGEKEPTTSAARDQVAQPETTTPPSSDSAAP